jgi:hypothetical protein
VKKCFALGEKRQNCSSRFARNPTKPFSIGGVQPPKFFEQLHIGQDTNAVTLAVVLEMVRQAFLVWQAIRHAN